MANSAIVHFLTFSLFLGAISCPAVAQDGEGHDQTHAQLEQALKHLEIRAMGRAQFVLRSTERQVSDEALAALEQHVAAAAKSGGTSSAYTAPEESASFDSLMISGVRLCPTSLLLVHEYYAANDVVLSGEYLTQDAAWSWSGAGSDMTVNVSEADLHRFSRANGAATLYFRDKQRLHFLLARLSGEMEWRALSDGAREGRAVTSKLRALRFPSGASPWMAAHLMQGSVELILVVSPDGKVDVQEIWRDAEGAVLLRTLYRSGASDQEELVQERLVPGSDEVYRSYITRVLWSPAVDASVFQEVKWSPPAGATVVDRRSEPPFSYLAGSDGEDRARREAAIRGVVEAILLPYPDSATRSKGEVAAVEGVGPRVTVASGGGLIVQSLEGAITGPAGERAKKRFWLVNSGADDILVKTEGASCACIEAAISNELIEPGVESTLDVEIMMPTRPGLSQAVVTLLIASQPEKIINVFFDVKSSSGGLAVYPQLIELVIPEGYDAPSASAEVFIYGDERLKGASDVTVEIEGGGLEIELVERSEEILRCRLTAGRVGSAPIGCSILKADIVVTHDGDQERSQLYLLLTRDFQQLAQPRAAIAVVERRGASFDLNSISSEELGGLRVASIISHRDIVGPDIAVDDGVVHYRGSAKDGGALLDEVRLRVGGEGSRQEYSILFIATPTGKRGVIGWR